jgi:hypothetical protein
MKTTRLSIFPSLTLSSPFLTSVFPLLLTFLTFFAASVATAQSITPSVINSTGGTATVGNFIVDWNVGESIITTQTNGIIVTNGQLQPVDEIISVEELNTSWNISVYPNPTRDEFVITSPNAGVFEASLFDLAGKFISKQTLMSTNRMDVRSLANGSYYLQVRNIASQEFKTITLIKAN